MEKIMKWLTKPKEKVEYLTVKPRDFFSRVMAGKKSLHIVRDPWGHFCILWFKENHIYNTFISERGLVWKTLKEYIPEKNLAAVDEADFWWLREIKWRKAKKLLNGSAFKDFINGAAVIRIY